MNIKIVYSAEEILDLKDKSIINTLIIDSDIADKDVVIEGFENLILLTCTDTAVESIRVENCARLETVEITDNAELVSVYVESSRFKNCKFTSLPKLKELSVLDISTVYNRGFTSYMLEIANTGIEDLHLERCLNLSGLVLRKNTELKNVVINDVGKLGFFYTLGNSKYELLTTNIGTDR